ncbi:MAG: hypothetical protein JSU06_00320 [Actinobacteria bacterium]|nr:hypothetical protein [Actinomycetota bacterium]
MRALLPRLLSVGVVSLAILSICVPTAARAAPQGGSAGQPAAVLDPTFGSGGVVRLPSEASPSVALGASTQSGSLLVSDGASIQLLSDLGGTGEAFGGVGSLALPPAAGREFVLGGFTLDPQGRLLVAGTSLYPEAENPSPMREGGMVAFRPAALRVLRFLPDGSLDSSFGQGGVVETDLGLPAPFATDGHRRLGSRPAVRATGITVDAQGRIVVTGDAVVRLGRSCERNAFRPGVISAGFVARLGEGGVPDPAFGRNGLVGGRHLAELPLGAEVIEEPLVGPTGTITYRSSAIYPCVKDKSHIGLGQLMPDGQARSAFGRKGALVGRYTAVTGGLHGALFALAEVPRHESERFTARVLRIAPDGKPDAAFGTNGVATVKLGTGVGGVLNSMAVDGQGRVLIGGSIGVGKSLTMVLLRLSASGKQQMNFGPRGRVATHVPGLDTPSALFFDPEGRLVTVHSYTNVVKGRSALVVARYLLRD